MSLLFSGKKILIGVSGGIAAYKVADWTRRFVQDGADVRIMMSESATRFVTPLSFAALSANRVHTRMFSEDEHEIKHISLAKEAELILIAPATASLIARLAAGMADELISSVVLATRAKVLICPAMNSNMYNHPATRANLERLASYGYTIVAPEKGELACGDKGVGRLADWQTVRQEVATALTEQDFAGKRLLITAGPTWEPLDPVRILTNRSSGKMGYALAHVAARRGAKVTLVSGPGNICPPSGVDFIPVHTAEQMHDAVMSRVGLVDVVIKAAAVSDYRPERYDKNKIKKYAVNAALPLAANPDILKELGAMKKDASSFPMLVGFAAESDNHLEEGQRKLAEKNLDLVAVNDISSADAGFAVDNNRVTLIDRDGAVEDLPLLSKEEVANRLLNTVLRLGV